MSLVKIINTKQFSLGSYRPYLIPLLGNAKNWKEAHNLLPSECSSFVLCTKVLSHLHIFH